MPDTRPRVPIPAGKTINLAQLSAEVKAALCASPTEVVAAEGATITQPQLEAGVAAHVPAPPAPAPVDTAAAQLNELLVVLEGKGSLTRAERQRIERVKQ